MIGKKIPASEELIMIDGLFSVLHNFFEFRDVLCRKQPASSCRLLHGRSTLWTIELKLMAFRRCW